VSAGRDDTAAGTIVARMYRWVCALVASAVVTGFAFLLVTGQYINEGDVVVSVTSTHGLHQGDVLVVLGWAVSLIAVFVLTVTPGRGTRGQGGPRA